MAAATTITAAADAPNLWITFTACISPHSPQDDALSPPVTPSSSLVLQLSTGRRREFSNIVHVKPDGSLSSPVQCSLSPTRQHQVVLHKAPPGHLPLSFVASAANAPAKPASLQLDPVALTALLRHPAATAHVAQATDGSTLHFTLSHAAAPPDEAEDATPVTPPITTPVSRPPKGCTPDLSFSSVSEDDGALDEMDLALSSPHMHKRARRVSFNKRIAEIPTTEMLQRDVHAALADRAGLWQGVGDLTIQLAQLRREVRALNRPTSTSASASTSTICSPTLSPCASPAPVAPSAARPPRAVPKRRRAVLDGDMLATTFGDGVFHTKGIQLALDYFARRGTHAVAVVSQTRLDELCALGDPAQVQCTHLRMLRARRLVATCPSHERRGHFLLRYAADHDADIVSNLWMHEPNVMTCGGNASPLHVREARLVQSYVTSFMFIADKFVPDFKDGGGPICATPSSRSNRRAVSRCGTL